MNSLTKESLIDYFEKNKPLIKPSKHLNVSAFSSGTPLFLAVSKDGYLSQEEYETIEFNLFNDLKVVSKYSSKVFIDNSKAPFFILRLEITDALINIKKNIINHAYQLRDDIDNWFLATRTVIDHTLFFESLDVTFKKDGYATPLRLGFEGIGGLNLKESLFKGLPLFYQVDDFEKEKHEEIATTLTYGDLLRAQRDNISRKELLEKHLKNAKHLDKIINFNKFTVTESYMLIKIATELDKTTLINFIRWYREKGRFYELRGRHDFKSQRKELITFFILYSINRLQDPVDFFELTEEEEHFYYIARDYYLMCKKRRRKLVVNFSSERALSERHDKLYASIRNKLLKDDDYNKDFEIYDKYLPLLKAIKKRGSGYRYLSSPYLLTKEGNQMGHCVGTYASYVKKGECVIVTTDIDDIHYTLEIEAVIRNHKLTGYSLAQMQSRFNHGVNNPNHKAAVIDFLNNITIDDNIKKMSF